MEIMQKRFLKIIYKKDYTYPTEKLYKETRALDVRQMYFIAVVSHQYKNRLMSPYVDHCYPTRHRNDTNLKTTFSEKTIGQRSHAYLAARLYNSLPTNIKVGIHSLSLFKNKVKKHLFHMDRLEIHNLIDPGT